LLQSNLVLVVPTLEFFVKFGARLLINAIIITRILLPSNISSLPQPKPRDLPSPNPLPHPNHLPKPHTAKMTATALEHLSLGGRIDWLSSLDTELQPARNLRRTSIICTIGPKTNSVEAINKLRDAGLNVVRMNFSHGSYEYHRTFCVNLDAKP